MDRQSSPILKCKGLPYKATKEQLMDFFRDYSPINVLFVYETDSGRPSGLAFVEFKSASLAVAALKQMNCKTMGQRYVKLLQVLPAEMEEQVRFGTAAVPDNNNIHLNQGLPLSAVRRQSRQAGGRTTDSEGDTAGGGGGVGLEPLEERLWMAAQSVFRAREVPGGGAGMQLQLGDAAAAAVHAGADVTWSPVVARPAAGSDTTSDSPSSGHAARGREAAGITNILRSFIARRGSAAGAANSHAGWGPLSATGEELPGQQPPVTAVPRAAGNLDSSVAGSGVAGGGGASMRSFLALVQQLSQDDAAPRVLAVTPATPLLLSTASGVMVEADTWRIPSNLCTVMVQGLPQDRSYPELTQLLEAFAPQYTVAHIMLGLSSSRRPSGEAYMTFADTCSAHAASEQLGLMGLKACML